MQVVTCIKTTRKASSAATRTRLLEAAARVFARSGLAGSTTRAIAAEAGVNEVTLFRHFETKDRLLAAVVGHTFGDQASAVQVPPPAPTGHLREDLLAFGRHYEQLLTENLGLVRTMLGEIQHHHRSQERQVFHGVFRPLKEALLAYLQAAQEGGRLRREVPADILADLFGGIIFTGVIRRTSSQVKLGYTAEAYLEAAVDTLLHGATGDTRRS